MYKYGFKTKLKTTSLDLPLSKELISTISRIRQEDRYFLEWRLKAYTLFEKSTIPKWSKLDLSGLDIANLCYFSSVDKTENNSSSLQELAKKLHLPENAGNDLILDSSVVMHQHGYKILNKHGIIFSSLSKAIKEHPELVKKYLGSVVPIGDNYFATLNSAVFSDGTFIYIPANTKCPIPLSTYFRINTSSLGQFERTLIVVDKNSEVDYFEGCTSHADTAPQLHAAVVEIIALEGSRINYTTVQNWYAGHNKSGGVYNLVTKRGLSLKNSRITWKQIEQGSAITWKYPSVVLAGDNSIGEFTSLSLTKGNQQAETGTKMTHLGAKSQSKISAHSVSLDNSMSVYRSRVYMSPRATYSNNWSNCETLMLNSSSSYMIPEINIQNSNSSCEHEAQTWSLSPEQIKYLQLRGANVNQACSAVILGFCKPITKDLPFEMSIETEEMIHSYINDRNR